jgi:hypothetical protein
MDLNLRSKLLSLSLRLLQMMDGELLSLSLKQQDLLQTQLLPLELQSLAVEVGSNKVKQQLVLVMAQQQLVLRRSPLALQ